MKKALLGLAVLAAVLATTALAATPQGHLSGAGGVPTTNTITRIDVATTASDGEQVYVALNNDKSKPSDCDGDVGAVNVKYDDNSIVNYTLDCVHYTGQLRITIDWYDTHLNKWVLFRVRDLGSPGTSDWVSFGFMGSDQAKARACVNRGWGGGGCDVLEATAGSGYSHTPEFHPTNGNFTVTA